MAHEISVNTANSLREFSVQLDTFSETVREIAHFSVN